MNDEDVEELRVEAVVVDYYMSSPLPAGAVEKLPASPCYLRAREVPVVRIFGATPAGQKALVHVHGMFPYFYFRAEDDPDFEDPERLRTLLPRLAKDIEAANASKQQQRQQNNGNATAKFNPCKIIAKMLIVQGTPFYGYHPRPKLFVQIFLYNPRVVASVVQLLESGGIGERRFQPYEAHIPFLLQVFADYNIEGMNNVAFSDVKFRFPLPVTQEHLAEAQESGEYRAIFLPTTPIEKISGLDKNATPLKGRYAPVPQTPKRWFDRQSSCALEADVAAACILNPKQFESQQKAAEGTGELRNVPSLAAIWKEERLRRIQNGETGTPMMSLSLQRNPDALRGSSMSASPAASASSLLSQSFFQKKMKDSVDAVMEELEKQEEEQRTKGGYVDTLSAGDVISCGNSFAAESEFSYSQAELESNFKRDSDQETAEEDEAIVNILLEMQQVGEPGHKEDEWQVKDEHDGYNTPDDNDDDEGIGKWDNRDDEIGDILASQRLVEEHNASQGTDSPKGSGWWDIAERESRPIASPLSELGSPRVILHTPNWRSKKSSLNAARSIRFGATPEDLPLVGDIEDLLPPRPQEPIPLTPPEEESDPVDRLQLSLTPHPQPLRANPRVQPPKAAAGNKRLWVFSPEPPTYSQILASSHTQGVDPMQYQPAFYSNAADIPGKAMVFGGKKFDFTPQSTSNLPVFDTTATRQLLNPLCSGGSTASMDSTPWCKLSLLKTPSGLHQRGEKVRHLRMPVRLPPDTSVVEAWVSSDAEQHRIPAKARHKRARPSLTSTMSPSIKLTSSTILSNITILSLEIFAGSRGNMLPNPLYDPVNVICYAVEAQEGPTDYKTKERGFLMLKADGMEQTTPKSVALCVDSRDISVLIVSDERELLHSLEALIRRWDPDFLAGFEVQKASIGYLVDRASQLDINLIQSLSRLPSARIDPRNTTTVPDQEGDSQKEASIGTTWGVNKAAGLWLHGRYILNLWRLTRSELKLSRYALEDVVWAVLKRTYPVYSAEKLTLWFQEGGQMRWKVVRYCLERATLNLQIISKMQLITKTSEMARLFGIDFYSVLSRGSQYRVEAVMLRVTKRKNFLLVSPSRNQVAGQAPMECIPLVMEPHSSFYPDPVVVLDFQSLYPSLVIGYNLCYSSLLGRLKDGLNPELETSLGVVDFTPSTSGLLRCRGDVIIAPNGTLFCPKSYRHGVLPLILDEILSTRIMVKKSMKSAKGASQERLEKVLNARQLALKMISNVTYGYTAAGFSGRMPCAQLADAIVQTGRCTLEAAVRLIEGKSDWNARVVYGDTDSVFVLLKGRSKQHAFRIGQEIADAVTASNPRPVTLKLEKVYMGCVLVSKKRYVGNKFESPTQEVGIVESKGLETVRRDSCGVVQHAMQASLETLFASSDLSKVKEGMEKYWIQILENRVPLKEFIFAKEVRLGTYSNGSAPPAALVSVKAMGKDPRAEPRYAERVPYVVVNGPPGARLMDLVVSPDEYFDKRKRYSINYHYYINKQIIPSLERLFLLTGANIRSWYTTLPRSSVKARQHVFDNATPTRPFGRGFRSIDAFYLSKHCRLCRSIGNDTLCQECTANPQRSLLAIHTASTRHEQAVMALKLACTACADRDAFTNCNNVACRVWNHIKLFEVDKATLTYQER
ncbi:DNA polymerase zeta catalytic subunit [Phytophthora cactorum]|uniref:DNA polymerase n=1 Tax=Phytophthora cactorum TaxID=29920 RepID=A0A329T4L1_9STRA|nr:DNA polymerase zeta catalytic subunit [Phytophthora cactorum]KAG2843834.1 DNA polymerase zeta catalytic subunit [Phytophthora cactorum]KAG2845928.1 DNA polymerase zeta catalytic subunit [Phytophthora cactorum]KAG2866924.1 DNA polymerase zeta catalytic subunit [Phytophthora cactorum]KAG2932421.1 DNA polymerase zeta catalytic subunit [Phytophthora cactorum]